jgi:hypothetical protein
MRILIIGLILIFLHGCNSAYTPTRNEVKPQTLSKEEIEKQRLFIANLNYNSFNDYEKDITKVIGSKLEKDSLESTQEFLKRKAGVFERYKHKAYKIRLDVDNKDNKNNEMVYFDPDASMLVVKLPSRDKDIIGWHPKQTSKAIWLHSSYIRLKHTTQDLSTYVGSNAFGHKVEITKLRETGIGIAILNTIGDWNAKSQTFTMSMQRDLAKEVLSNGVVEMDVFIDYPYIDINRTKPFVEDTVTREPKMDNPVDVDVKYQGFPARLVAIRLLNAKGEILNDWKGQQIFTPAASVQ